MIRCRLGPTSPNIREKWGTRRILTTAAILLGLLAIITGACTFLYRALVLPLVSFLIAAIAKGSITVSALSDSLGMIITGIVMYFLLKYLTKDYFRKAEEILNHAHGVLHSNQETLTLAQQVSDELAELEGRVSRLETH